MKIKYYKIRLNNNDIVLNTRNNLNDNYVL